MTDQDQNRVNAEPTSPSHCKPPRAPGGHQGSCDLPVSSVLFQIESSYGFTPLTIIVGTSYFRRLAASNQAMLQVSTSHPTFIGLVRGLTFTEPGKPLVGAIHAPYLSNEVWLTLIHLTCTYIAAQNLADIPWRCSLRAIISHIYGVESCAIDPELSSDLEIQCLEALDYRLGPSVVQQEDMSHAAARKLPVSPVACSQEQPGNNGTQDPALQSADVAPNSATAWMANMKEPSAVSVDRIETVNTPERSHALLRIPGTSSQPKSAISKLERSMYIWHQHRAVHWVLNLASIFLMFLLIAIRSNSYFMTVAFLPSLLGQQTAYWGLTFSGWGLDNQKSMAKWFFKALRAGAIITAICSAAVATAAITYDASRGAAASELLHVGTSGVPMETFTGACYALHAIVSIMAAKNAHQVQGILDQTDGAMMA